MIRGGDKRKCEPWTIPEIDLAVRYFQNTWTPETLTVKIQQINPQRTYESVARRLRRMAAEAGYVKSRETFRSGLRVGYFDIEATHLKADFGIVLCYYFKTAGKNEYYSSCITRKEILSGTQDKRIITDFFKHLDHYDVIYAHYGEYFDLPFMRTRALAHGLESQWPKKNFKYFGDTWRIAKKRLQLSSNRLANLISFCEVEGEKTKVSGRIWNDVLLGGDKKSREALKYVDTHCKIDVVELERVHEKIKPYETIPLKSL